MINQIPPAIFDKNLQEILSTQCEQLTQFATDEPSIGLPKIKVYGSSIILSLYIGGFHQNSRLTAKDERGGMLSLKIDDGPWIDSAQFVDGMNVIVLRGLASGIHRVIYALRTGRGVVGYGQRCIMIAGNK